VVLIHFKETNFGAKFESFKVAAFPFIMSLASTGLLRKPRGKASGDYPNIVEFFRLKLLAPTL
jgi:hypothetical protein